MRVLQRPFVRVALLALALAAIVVGVRTFEREELVLRGATDAGVTRATDGRPLLALTFDDGLNGETTAAVATTLERRGAQGTFFVVGNTVAAQRDLALRLIEGGHLLGNHNEVHERAQAADARYTTLAAAQTSIHAATGRCPAYFRPPFGAETQATKVAVRRAGMRTVLWDVEVADWSETDANRLAANVLERLRPGSIVLLHDGADGVPGADRSVLLRALPTILGGIEARGWRAVRVDTLLNESGYLDRC